MKYLLLICSLSISTVFAQEVKLKALDDDFKLAPSLEKGNSDYDVKSTNQGKIFKKNSPNVFKITKGKESLDKIEVYQLKLEKNGDKVEKVEKFVEVDKESLGKIKTLYKCRMSSGENGKGGCQRYTKPFCSKLVEEKSKVDESKPEEMKNYFKNIYTLKGVYGLKSDEIAKIHKFNQDSRKDLNEEPMNDALKSKISSIYPPVSTHFTVEKIKHDIAECEKVKNDFKVEIASGPKKSSSDREPSATKQ